MEIEAATPAPLEEAQEEEHLLEQPPSSSPGGWRGVGAKAAIVAVGLLMVGSACAGLKSAPGFAATSEELDIIQEVSTSQRNEILERHNVYRCMHGVPPLKWSNSVQRGAEQDVKANGFHHTSREGVGENLAWRSSGLDGEASVDDWYNEIDHTPGKKGAVSQFGGHTGHYTQVVWKGTTHVGCGYHNKVLSCQYSPPGNYGGQFPSNVKTVKKSFSACSNPSSADGPATCATDNGAPCKFPFEYDGKTYSECTSDGHHTDWCYTDDNGGWGHCDC